MEQKIGYHFTGPKVDDIAKVLPTAIKVHSAVEDPRLAPALDGFFHSVKNVLGGDQTFNVSGELLLPSDLTGEQEAAIRLQLLRIHSEIFHEAAELCAKLLGMAFATYTAETVKMLRREAGQVN
jgi:hypothetical protein